MEELLNLDNVSLPEIFSLIKGFFLRNCNGNEYLVKDFCIVQFGQ